MAIQGTQVPMYTKHSLFLYFSDFFKFFFHFYIKKKINNNNNKNMLNNQSKKTKLTQNLKAKHISNAHIKQEEREKSDRITWSPFLSTSWKNLSFD